MIRQLQTIDAAKIATLDALAFADCWSEKSWCSELAAGLVFGYFIGEQLIGVASFHLVLDEAELYKIMVLPSYRQQGIARQLLIYGFEKLHDSGAETLFLEVAEHNLAAVRLYQALGFQQTGFRANYYDNPPDNALLMSRGL